MTLVSSPNFTTLLTFETSYSADSIEWCPHEPNQNIFVCANYQLIEASQNSDNEPKRIGKIYLFSIHPEKGLLQHQTLQTPAILDQKWCLNKINNRSVLGTVNADNSLDIYELIDDKDIKLNLITSYANNDPGDKDVMLLSLDWSTGKYESEEPKIIASDTNGRINLFQYRNGVVEKLKSLNGHEFEAWICAFYYWDTQIIFSGGDDAKLLHFDLRVSNEPITTNKSHIAGVTCIHSNKEKEYLLATGSYDTHLLLWDIRNMKKYKQLIEMPGPMWRLKWDPLTHDYLLAACMLGGFHIVNTVSDESKLLNYYEHPDLAYGSDWSYLSESDVKNYGTCDGNRIVATCSFYDKKMCVSKVDIGF